MELFLDWMRLAGQALAAMLAQPFFYLAVLVVLLQYRRQIYLERKLYHVRLHSLPADALRAVGFGLLAGVFASAVMAGFGARLAAGTVLWLWGIALVLMLFRVRFLCFAYAAGVLGLLHAAAVLWNDGAAAGQGGTPGGDPSAWGGWAEAAWNSLLEAHMPSVFVLVALMHLIEALLVRADGARMAMPLFLKGKRGKLVGGYQIQGFWPVPLLLPVPAASAAVSPAGALSSAHGPASADGLSLPWTPLFGSGVEAWGMLAVPLLIGFTELTTSMLPERKARRSAAGLAGFSVLLFATAIAAQWSVWLVVLASAVSILMHEAMMFASRLKETSSAPLFVHTPQGLKVLGVLPGSPASELGIRPGETIHRVNGERVATRAELHRAMRRSPAFVKLELLDLNGENRFAQRAVYDGDHHLLGIILAPDEQAPYYLEYVQRPIFGYIWMALSGLLSSRSQPRGGGAASAATPGGPAPSSGGDLSSASMGGPAPPSGRDPSSASAGGQAASGGGNA